jgi:hypothetical protein
MSIHDFNKLKPLKVKSITNTPSVNKAQPIYITSGDDSTTGTGVVVLDWSNINGVNDIAVYDQNGNLLNYQIEKLDTTNKTGLIWVYNSWIRDGTVQVKLAYGAGPSDNQKSVDTWNSDNATVVYNYENTGTSDSINDNNLTLNGATTTSGIHGQGLQFDGVDDSAEATASQDFHLGNGGTIVLWYKPTTGAQGNWNQLLHILDELQIRTTDTSPLNILAQHKGHDQGNMTHISTTPMNNGEYYLITFKFNSSENSILSIDSQSEDTNSFSSGYNFSSNSPIFGRQRDSDRFFCTGIIDSYRFFKEFKYNKWVTAEYDASSKAGQVFFSQESATTPPPPSSSIVFTESGVNQTNSNHNISTAN